MKKLILLLMVLCSTMPAYASEPAQTEAQLVEPLPSTEAMVDAGKAETQGSFDAAVDATPNTATVVAEASQERLDGATTEAPQLASASVSEPKISQQKGPGVHDLLYVEPLEETASSDEVIWMGWTVFESGDESYAQVGGDGGHAFGRFQFDSRYDLAGFLQKCITYDANYAVKFGQFVTTKSGKPAIRTRSGLNAVWRQVYAERSEEFARLRIEFAAETYYHQVKEALAATYGINLDDYGPVLKGTVWSVALRDGNNVHTIRKYNNLRTVVDTYAPGISEETWLRAIYAAEAARHPSQAGRWNNKQLTAALVALAEEGREDVAMNELLLKGFEVITHREGYTAV